MTKQGIHDLLMATANVVESSNSDVAYVLRAIAGCVHPIADVDDMKRLRTAVQDWVREEVNRAARSAQEPKSP